MKYIAKIIAVAIFFLQGFICMSVIVVYLILSMLLVLYFDGTRYIIPNWLVCSMLLAYPFAAYTASSPVDWKMAAAGTGAVFVVGYIIFFMKWMGGGDIKLITACALWVGWSSLPDFIFITAIIGGFLSVIIWVIRVALPYIPRKTKQADLPRILQNGAPVPYGIAIAAGFLLMMWMGKIPVLA
jgi:prepilin peptidase CpaA